MEKQIIKNGTKVKYRPCFGMFPPTITTIEGIQKSDIKRCKYGDMVNSVTFEDKDYCVFFLSDGHWCYGEQVDEIVK